MDKHLLVIYNSNPQNKPDLPTASGWAFYTKKDWEALCEAVDNYLYWTSGEVLEHPILYSSYDEWLSHYQVSELPDVAIIQTLEKTVLNNYLGTSFYVPDLAVDDDPVYPEMDAYA